MGDSKVTEEPIPEFEFEWRTGEDFDKTVQLYTDDDCTVEKDFTYHSGVVKYKEDNSYSASVLEFSTAGGSLYLGSDGTIRMYRAKLNMPNLAEGDHRGDCRVINLNDSGKQIVCRFLLHVKKSAN